MTRAGAPFPIAVIVKRRALDKLFADWFNDKTAEYQTQGYGLIEAKEKAMSDWHTYEAGNVWSSPAEGQSGGAKRNES